MVSVQLITKDELSKELGTVQVVNVLDPKHYELGLIQGSRKIPLAELDQRVGELDKARDVVTYCASDQCNASKQAAEKLVAQGFKVRAYEGGIKEWKEAGLPLEPAVTATTSSTSCCSS